MMMMMMMMMMRTTKKSQKRNISHIWEKAPRKYIAMKFGTGLMFSR